MGHLFPVTCAILATSKALPPYVAARCWATCEHASVRQLTAVAPTHPPMWHISVGSSSASVFALHLFLFLFCFSLSRWISWLFLTHVRCFVKRLGKKNKKEWKKKKTKQAKQNKPRRLLRFKVSLPPKVKCCQKYLHADLFKYAAKTVPVVKAQAPLSSSRLLTRPMPAALSRLNHGGPQQTGVKLLRERNRTPRFLCPFSTVMAS